MYRTVVKRHMPSRLHRKPVLWTPIPTVRPVVEAHLRHVQGTFRAAGWRVVESEVPPEDVQGPLAILRDPWCQPLPAMASHLAEAPMDARFWRLPKVTGLEGPQAWPLRNGPYTPFDYAKQTVGRRFRASVPLQDPWCGFVVAAAGDGEALLRDAWPPEGPPARLVPTAHLFRYDDPAGHRREELDPFIPAKTRTLVDIGCGHGYLGERHRRTGRRVVGIEPDRFLAQQAAQRLDMVLPTGAVEGLAALKGDLDCIVFADVLEHTTDAAAVLRATARALSAEGRVIVSVPNFAWAPVLRALAAGRWDSTLAGTQARDHFTPFTRQSFVDLAAECGLRVVETSALEAPLPWRLRLWSWLIARSVGGLPDDLLATQWIFVLVRCNPVP